MKTTIDLTQFNFNSEIFLQISNDPKSGFVRVIVHKSNNFLESEKLWYLNLEIWLINPTNNEVIYKQKAKSKNGDWIVSNNYQITAINENGTSIVNTNFNEEEEISESNLPFLTISAFEFYKNIYVTLLRNLFIQGILNDDDKGFLDDRETYKTIVDIQKDTFLKYNQENNN